jgi:hypothetical protein
MPVCKDPRLTYLNNLGYNVVRLPRAGILPLGILGKDKNTIGYLGTLDEIWTTTDTVPKPSGPQAVGALNGQATSDMKLSVGMDILANALAGMFGASAPSVKFAYKAAKSVQFKFGDVKVIGIDPFLVGNYLTSGDLRDGSPFVQHFFYDVGTETYVITEVLQASSISVIGKKDGNTDVGIDVPALQSALGARVGVSAVNSDNTEITYTGPELLTFGFKVFGIGIQNGRWAIHGVDPGDDVSFDAPKMHPFLLSSSGMIDIEDSAGSIDEAKAS